MKNPFMLIDAYLYQAYLEAKRRGYRFNQTKVEPLNIKEEMTVTKGQLEFEFFHLLKKLEKRDKELEEIKNLNPKNIKPHPIFRVVNGKIEKWKS